MITQLTVSLLVFSQIMLWLVLRGLIKRQRYVEEVIRLAQILGEEKK